MSALTTALLGLQLPSRNCKIKHMTSAHLTEAICWKKYEYAKHVSFDLEVIFELIDSLSQRLPTSVLSSFSLEFNVFNFDLVSRYWSSAGIREKHGLFIYM